MSRHLQSYRDTIDRDTLQSDVITNRAAYKGIGTSGVKSERKSVYNTQQLGRQSEDFATQPSMVVRANLNFKIGADLKVMLTG